MIKEAEIKISSVIESLDESGLPVGDTEKNDSTHEGYYHIIDGGYFVTYTEENEGAKTLSEVKLYPDGRVTVSRSGALESSFLFEEGASHTSLYKVPPYTFDAEITTRRIRSALTEDGGTLELIYNMKIGGAVRSARMKIWISTNSRQN